MEYVRKEEAGSTINLTSCTYMHRHTHMQLSWTGTIQRNKSFASQQLVISVYEHSLLQLYYTPSHFIVQPLLVAFREVQWTAQVLQHPVWTFLSDPTDGTDGEQRWLYNSDNVIHMQPVPVTYSYIHIQLHTYSYKLEFLFLTLHVHVPFHGLFQPTLVHFMWSTTVGNVHTTRFVYK